MNSNLRNTLLAALACTSLGLAACASTKEENMDAAPAAESASMSEPAAATDTAPPPADATPPTETETPPPASGTP